jgi:hypothetical protein
MSLPSDKLSGISRLALIRTKTKWAEKHLDNLEKLAKNCVFDSEYIVRSHPNPQKRGLQRIDKMPFDVILGAGDVIHNLRSALDHLAYNLVQVAGNKPYSGTGFPIAESMTKYETVKARKVEGMSSDAKRAIDGLKPYRGGNEPLWRIHDLDIVDKHRGLVVVAENFLFTADHIEGPYLAVGEETHFSGIFAPDLNQESETLFEPALIEPQTPKPQPLIPALHEFVIFIDDLIGNFLPLLE